MDFNKEGMSWQTGRMPEIDHIYGGKATVALVDNVFVLAPYLEELSAKSPVINSPGFSDCIPGGTYLTTLISK